MTVSKQILKSGDAGVAQTMQLMKSYVLEYANNPQIKQIVNKLSVSGTCNAKMQTMKNIFNFVVDTIRYTPDPNGVELVKSAKHTILGNMKYGDCDDLSVALATLYKSLGLNVWFRAVAWKRASGNAFTHVYVVIELPCGKFVMPCDPSMGKKGFGNEVTYFRKMDVKI